MSYRYPDFSDRITTTFINENELYPGYWQESEEMALALASSKLTRNKTDKALDVGCGEGRLTPWLRSLAGSVTATEPDISRLAIAKRSYPDLEIYPEVEDLKDTYDIVLCSHVIQHIPTYKVIPFLKKLYHLTKPRSRLVLLYSRAPFGADYFSLETVQGGKINSQRVDDQTFDKVLANREEGILPVHYFDPVKLKNTGATIGWDEVFRWTFHITEEKFDGENPDENVNANTGMFQRRGRDMLVIWQRK